MSNQESKIRACRGFSALPLGGGMRCDDGFEHVFDAEAAFCADQQRVGGGNGEDVFDLFFDEVGLRGGQIDFVDDRNEW